MLRAQVTKLGVPDKSKRLLDYKGPFAFHSWPFKMYRDQNGMIDIYLATLVLGAGRAAIQLTL